VAIEIRKAPQMIVCGRTFWDVSDCTAVAIAHLDLLKDRTPVLESLPSDAPSFNANSADDSRFQQLDKAVVPLSALVVNWNGRLPRPINYRTDFAGNDLNRGRSGHYPADCFTCRLAMRALIFGMNSELLHFLWQPNEALEEGWHQA